jgi:hypothetical protein
MSHNLANTRTHIPLPPSRTRKTKVAQKRAPAAPIRKVSKKRASQSRLYAKLREEFLKEHPYCQWTIWHYCLSPDEVSKCGGMMPINGQICCVPKSTEIHHRKGRFGSRLNQTEFWMAVSRDGHDWIHANPKPAYEKGYLLPR